MCATALETCRENKSNSKTNKTSRRSPTADCHYDITFSELGALEKNGLLCFGLIVFIRSALNMAMACRPPETL